MSDDRLSQARLDLIIDDPLRATPVDAERMARELAGIRERARRRKRKVTTEQIIEMRRRRAEGEALRSIAGDYGISHTHVKRICDGTF